MGLPNSAAISFGLLLSGLAAIVQASSFSYSPTNVDSCGNVTISWSSGTAPFYLLAVPVFGVPRNFSIPDSAYSNGQGSYTTQLKFSTNKQYILVLSDSTGFGTGGISPVLETTSKSAGNCNPNVTADFTFQLNDNLQQCREFSFTDYDNATQPVTIFGVIPAGQPFTLSPPKGPNSYSWPAVDIYNSTSVLFLMEDSKGKQGGSGALLSVGVTDDASCINSTSPSATASSQFATATSSSSSGSSSSKTGAIIGSVLGGVLVFAVVISLTLFYLRRRKEREVKNPWIEASGAFLPRSDNLNLLADVRDPSTPAPGYLPTSNHQRDYQSRSSEVTSGFNRPASSIPSSAQYLPAGTEVTPFTTSSDEGRSTQRTGKGGSSAPSNRAPRYILHHDAEDIPGEEEPEEVVELPPQYTERRAPPSGNVGEGSSSSAGPSTTGFPADRKYPS